jgi:hypothetical protein
MIPKLCKFCGQPMKPKGIKKLPNEYDHAQGCPYYRKRNFMKIKDLIFELSFLPQEFEVTVLPLNEKTAQNIGSFHVSNAEKEVTIKLEDPLAHWSREG